VALSKNQEVELKVLSLWDIAAGLLLGLFLSLGLLILGRPQLVCRRRSKEQVLAMTGPWTGSDGSQGD
jgi:hypothetical protein